jgi:geranylgeranyl pyrophosphate synthase
VFRPALAALSCEAVGGQPEATDDAGLMFALASAGFGLHDDIIDRSDRKHFATTILGRYGLESALLIGDLLIVKAWTTIHNMNSTLPAEKIRALIAEYGRLNVEICEAEFLENRCRKKLQTELKTFENILWKAMAEIEACTKIGAIIGDGDTTEVQALAEFGRRLGFAYRLTDEVRDTLNLEGNLPSRIEHESVPLPILFASKSSTQRYQRIQSIIQKNSLAPSDIKELLETCFDSKAFEYVFDLAKSNYEKNLATIESLKPSLARDALSSLCRQSYVNIADLVL